MMMIYDLNKTTITHESWINHAEKNIKEPAFWCPATPSAAPHSSTDPPRPAAWRIQHGQVRQNGKCRGSFWGFYRDVLGILWGFEGNFRENLGECDWEGNFIVTWRGFQKWVLTNDSGRPSDGWEIPALAVFSAGKIIKPLLGKFPKSHVWLS